MSIVDRIDAITAIPQAYRAEVLPPPRSVKIELTANCPHKCTFCVKSLRPDNGEMDRALYSRIVNELAELGVEEVGLFYIGESFTCLWLSDAIKEAKAAGIPYVFLTTNGTAAKPERVRAAMEAGLDSLKFSLNYADAEQMEQVARVPQSNFRRMIHHIKEARLIRDSGNYATRLYASSIDFDGEQGEKMRALVSEIEPFVDEHYWLPLFSMDGAASASGRKPTPGNPGRRDMMRPPLPCWAVTTGHITKDGQLSACCFGQGMDGSLIMGDLTKTDFMTAWNSAEFQNLRRAHLNMDVSNTPCSACVAG